MRLHPVTRARLDRFRRMRRGWWAFWILTAAFIASLFAEGIANDRPLWIRFNGRHFFPILRFYPEDAFTGNGRMTRPDYKSLARSPSFAPDTSNRMLWPPIPFGPLESVPPEDILTASTETVLATPLPRVASADIDAAHRIQRVAGDAESFSLHSLAPLEDIPADIAAALAERFQNRASAALDAPWRGGWLSLSPYAPRERPPVTLRLTFRDTLESPAPRRAIVDTTHPIWPPDFPPPGTPGWTFEHRREDVRFPFRPVKGHPMGLDASGRDVAARMIYALRTSLLFGLLLVVTTMALGTAAGAWQGYHGGAIDLLGQRLIEIWGALPFLYVLILLGSVYGRSFGLLLAVYAVFNWIGISHYMRAEFLRLRKLPFVEAATVIGLPPRKIIFRHMLPNALVPLVTFFPFQLVGAIGVMAALDYLGFGLPPPTPSWGELLSQAQEFSSAWWLALFPSLALFGVMLAGVFVGEALRAAFDPRTLGHME